MRQQHAPGCPAVVFSFGVCSCGAHKRIQRERSEPIEPASPDRPQPIRRDVARLLDNLYGLHARPEHVSAVLEVFELYSPTKYRVCDEQARNVLSLDDCQRADISAAERRADIIRSAARGQGPTFIAAKLDLLIESVATVEQAKQLQRHGVQEECILPDKHPLRIRAEKAEAELAALRAERDAEALRTLAANVDLEAAEANATRLRAQVERLRKQMDHISRLLADPVEPTTAVFERICGIVDAALALPASAGDTTTRATDDAAFCAETGPGNYRLIQGWLVSCWRHDR